MKKTTPSELLCHILLLLLKNLVKNLYMVPAADPVGALPTTLRTGGVDSPLSPSKYIPEI